MSIKLNSIQEALRFRGEFISGRYIDCDGVDIGQVGCDDCVFKGVAHDHPKWGCYLLAEKGFSKEEISKKQRGILNQGDSCEWYCCISSSTIRELAVRGEIIRIAKKLGCYEEP